MLFFYIEKIEKLINFYELTYEKDIKCNSGCLFDQPHLNFEITSEVAIL